MSKPDVVSAAKASFVSAQDGALQSFGESCYDGGAVDQKASDGTLTQADLDAAVKAATDPLNAQIAQDATDLAKAHSDADAAAAALKTSTDALAAMTADDASKTKAVADVQANAVALQAALDVIKGLLAPPAPVPPAS